MNILIGLIVSIFVKSFFVTYKWLDQNMITSILNIVRSFEYAIIICCAIVFLLVTVFITLRQARKLPKSYIVEVVDIYGQRVTPEGLRLVFATHDAAESYTQFYHQIYREQYKFRVVGIK
jgi:quinol-cytochrome oxidoreductase complex cytochrome b subunit